MTRSAGPAGLISFRHDAMRAALWPALARAAGGAALGLCLAVGIAGCAVTSLRGERLPVRSDAFADYVEAVFRRQNEVATELVFALERADPDSERYVRLEAAELMLLMACRGLNEIAQRRRDGAEAGGLGALRRARQAPDCEAATLEAAAVLED